MALPKRDYHHKPSHCGTNPQSCCWVHLSIHLLQIFGVLVASLPNYCCVDRFCRGTKLTFHNSTRFFKFSVLPQNPIGQITIRYHFVHAGLNGIIVHRYQWMRSLRLHLRIALALFNSMFTLALLVGMSVPEATHGTTVCYSEEEITHNSAAKNIKLVYYALSSSSFSISLSWHTQHLTSPAKSSQKQSSSL